MAAFTEYTTGLTAGAGLYASCLGPDGNVWFTEYSKGKVCKVTSSGTITEYTLNASENPRGICAGPDGNLWVAGYGLSKVYKVTTSGTVTTYSTTTGAAAPFQICSDGTNLWVTYNAVDKVAKVTTAGVFTEYSSGITAGASLAGICLGPDGNLWACAAGTSKVLKITTAGTVTEYATTTASANPLGICSGNDGNLWVCEFAVNKVAKVTTGGSFTEYTVTSGSPYGICNGPDANLWFTKNAGHKLSQITTSGTVTDFTPTTTTADPYFPCSDASGYVWFGELTDNKIAKYGTLGPVTSATDSGTGSEGTSAVTVGVYSTIASSTLAADDFTDTSNTNLESHAPTGTGATGTWTRDGTSSSGTPKLQISSAGRLKVQDGTATNSFYYESVTPASADYNVQADVAIRTLTNVQSEAGVLGRWSTSGLSGYFAFIDQGNFTATGYLRLYRYGGSGSAELGNYNIGTLTAGTTYTVKLVMTGTSISVYLNGTQRISVTETSITSAGRAGVCIGENSTRSVPTDIGDDTGLQLDNWSASIPASVALPSDSATGTDSSGSGPVSTTLVKPAPQTRTTSGARRDISTGKLTVHTWTGFNGAVRCPNGDLLVASPDGASETAGPYTTMFLRSTDGGTTWTNEGNHGWEGDAAVFWFTVLENGTIVLTTIVPGNTGAGEPSWVTLLSTSTDNGHTWAPRTRITTFGLSIGTDSSHISAGGLIELADGTWLCAWERVKASGDIDTYVSKSTDGGTTWTGPTVIGSHTGDAYDEPTLVKLKDGRIACFIRVELAPNTAGSDKRIYVAYSSDNGATWTTPTECFRNASGHPAAISTPDGAILIAYRMQPTTTSGPTAVRQSLDYGATWSSEVQIGQNSYQSLYGQAVLTAPRGGGSSDVTFFFAEEPISGGGTVGAVYAQDYTGVASGVDLAVGTETSTVNIGVVNLSTSDTATGTDASSLSITSTVVSKSATDSGALSESSSVQANVTFASLSSSDTGHGTDVTFLLTKSGPSSGSIVLNTTIASTLYGSTTLTSAQAGSTSVHTAASTVIS